MTVEGICGSPSCERCDAGWGAFPGPATATAWPETSPNAAPPAEPCFSGASAFVADPLDPLLEPLHPATPDAATMIAVIAATVLIRIVSPPIVGSTTGDRSEWFPAYRSIIYTASGSTPATHSSTAARSGPHTNTTSVLRR
jgi:hypothetical protein